MREWFYNFLQDPQLDWAEKKRAMEVNGSHRNEQKWGGSTLDIQSYRT